MRRRLTTSCLVAAGTLALLWWSTSAWPAAVAAKPATHTVIIEEMRFQPDVLTIKAGDSVVWINKDLFPHTATSKAGDFDSQQIAANASWRRTFKEKGEFAYVCTLHPPMKATVTVR